MKKMTALLGSLAAITLSAATANATTIPVPVGAVGNPHFTADTSTPGLVLADFGATVFGPDTSFDYSFDFTVPANGVGSGSVSFSSSSALTAITVTAVIINGTTYSVADAQAGIDDVPIIANEPDYIEIIGETGPSAVKGIFSGTATFTATVPEPITWATFLLGFGFIGLAVRRKLSGQVLAA